MAHPERRGTQPNETAPPKTNTVEQLSRELEIYRFILSEVSDGVARITPQSEVLEANNALRRLVGNREGRTGQIIQ